MNRVICALTNLMRSSLMRGEKGWVAPQPAMVLVAVLVGLVGLGAAAQKKAHKKATRSSGAVTSNHHSTTIALTSDETRVAVVNREANSLSIIQVKDAQGNDVAIKLNEIGVGEEPRCVAVHPTDRVAYVTNGVSGTVSAVNLVLGRVATAIKVGTEPRGCALTAMAPCSMWQTIPRAPCPSSTRAIRLIRSSWGPCQWVVDPSPLRSRIIAPAIFPTTWSSSPRSSPNSTPTSSTPRSTAMVRRAISENEGSSRPSR